MRIRYVFTVSAAVCLLLMGGCATTSTSVPATSNALVYGNISTFAGTGVYGYSGDGGPATSAKLYQPYALAFDVAGDLYVGDAADEVVREISAGSGQISTYAGLYTGFLSGGYSGNGGPAGAAKFYGPFGLAFDSGGNLYVADEANNVVRKITASTGIVNAFAGNAALSGTGNGTYTGDGGLALSAGLYHPYKLAFDAAGNLYICDTGNGVIRKVSAATGVISTVAGTGILGESGDGGPATSARLYHPEGIAFDSAGNLYIADQAVNVVRKVNASTGTISTVAGNYGLGSGLGGGYSGDGGPATQAQLNAPCDVAIDGDGNLLIADTSNNVVRRVTLSTGIIDTIVGTTQGYGGDGGPAKASKLNNPYGLAFDAAGNLYIADSANGVVRKVNTSR